MAVEATGSPVSDFNKGNIKARCRMIAQYALAGAHSGAVIGTDHAAENITGFFTKFGDGGADILPLYRLNANLRLSCQISPFTTSAKQLRFSNTVLT